MKKIHQLALEEYNKNMACAEKYRTPDHYWADWFTKGARAAQEWINAADEEPPVHEPILCLAGSSDVPFVGFYNGRDGIIIRGSQGIEYDRLMYWRPIERK